jgi:hypothetical protein
MLFHPAATTALVAPCAALMLVVAACGGGSGSPQVANLGSTTTPTGQSGSGSGGGGPQAGSAGSGSGGGPSLRLQIGAGTQQNAAKFSVCMRAHGVRNFPDPSAQGGISIGPSSGIDPNSPTFQAAQQACQKLLPNGGRPSPQQLAKAQQQMLKFSACMRAHGLEDFPDPIVSGGEIQMKIRVGAGSDLNPNSPTFQAAQNACQGKLPFKGGGGTTSGGK